MHQHVERILSLGPGAAKGPRAGESEECPHAAPKISRAVDHQQRLMRLSLGVFELPFQHGNRRQMRGGHGVIAPVMSRTCQGAGLQSHLLGFIQLPQHDERQRHALQRPPLQPEIIGPARIGEGAAVAFQRFLDPPIIQMGQGQGGARTRAEMLIAKTLPDLQRPPRHAFGFIALTRIPVDLRHNGQDLSAKRRLAFSESRQDVLQRLHIRQGAKWNGRQRILDLSLFHQDAG